MEIALHEIEQLSPNDLIAYINDCINHDFNKLVQLLYRIDVSENKLKTILQSHPNEDAANLIAAVIIERLAATKAARASFATSNKIEDANRKNESNAAVDQEDELERL
jgi:hypothetical protein